MTLLPSHSIDTLRILAVHSLEQTVQSCRVRRDRHDVHVIWHQAVSDDLNRVCCSVFSKKAQIRRAVATSEEYALTMIATLGHMVRHARKQNTSMSWHA